MPNLHLSVYVPVQGNYIAIWLSADKSSFYF